MKFTVVGAYTGECCPKSHVWAKVVDAPNAKAAAQKLRRAMERRGDFPADMVVFPGEHVEACTLFEG